VNIKNILFKQEWKKLENYYYPGEKNKSKREYTRTQANLYYSKLKDLTDDEFILTINNIYNNCKYFPNIAEIREQVPHNMELKMNSWEDLNHEPLDENDKEWCRNFYKKYCDNEEEYRERLVRNGLDVNV